MTSHPHMSCRELVEFLMAYLDQELDPVIREQLEWHLRACPNCVCYFETYKTTTELARIAFRGDDEVPAELLEPLIQAILSARTKM